MYKMRMNRNKRLHNATPQSKNTVCANIKHTSIKRQISGQSIHMVKGCMYMFDNGRYCLYLWMGIDRLLISSEIFHGSALRVI